MKRILTIFGTRPEAIKLAPVILELKNVSSFQSRTCVTAQHREMLDQVLNLFQLKPDLDLNLMQPGQSLSDLTARVLQKVDGILEAEEPNCVLVQGDTSTVMATAMACFYRRIPLGHVEAGLRSGTIVSPFPEEVNRRIASLVSRFHFAPTQRAAQALLTEGVPKDQVFLTGNPVIDALQMIVARPMPQRARELLDLAGQAAGRSDFRLLLVTAHRRENFGPGFEAICQGLKQLVQRNPDIVLLYPVHLNPRVQEPVQRILGGVSTRIILCEPVAYEVLAHLMQAAYFLITDSGGIQEEAPSLGKPVLVMRTETERPEGIKAGTALLVGPDTQNIVRQSERLLHRPEAYRGMARASNPYGDGQGRMRRLAFLTSYE